MREKEGVEKSGGSGEGEGYELWKGERKLEGPGDVAGLYRMTHLVLAFVNQGYGPVQCAMQLCTCLLALRDKEEGGFSVRGVFFCSIKLREELGSLV